MNIARVREKRLWHREYGGLDILRSLCAVPLALPPTFYPEDAYLDTILSGWANRPPYTVILSDEELAQLQACTDRHHIQFMRIPSDVTRFCKAELTRYSQALKNNWQAFNIRWREWTRSPYNLAMMFGVERMKNWQIALTVLRLTQKDPFTAQQRLQKIIDAMRVQIDGVLTALDSNTSKMLTPSEHVMLGIQPAVVLPMPPNDSDVLAMTEYRAAMTCIVCLQEITDQAIRSSECRHDPLIHIPCFERLYTQHRSLRKFGLPKCPKWGCDARLHPDEMTAQSVAVSSATAADPLQELICLD